MIPTTSEGAAITAPSDIAWCAGLFEGEGSTWLDRKRTRSGDHDTRSYTGVKVEMTDHEPLARFQQIVGVGAIYAPARRPGARGRNARSWVWQARALDDVLHVLTLLYPQLCTRRQTTIRDCLNADTRLK